MTDSGSWERLRSIFDAVADLSPHERELFLDHELAGDSALRARIRVLLEAHDASGSLLASREELAGEAPAGIAAAARRPSLEAAGAGAAAPGAQVGPYRLLERIGEGGFASSSWPNSEPFARRIALKLLRADAASAQVLARFEAG
jgi:hypothetical protein